MNKPRVRKHETSFKVICILLGLAFVAGITFLCFSLFIPPKNREIEKPLNTIVTKPEAKNSESKETPSKEAETPLEDPNKTPKQNEDDGKTVTNSNELNLSLTKNEVVTSQGRQVYQTRLTIYELLNETGECVLEMKSSNGDYLKRTAKTFNDGANSASCEGFDVLTEGISAGTYNFTIKVTVGKRTGNLSGIINI